MSGPVLRVDGLPGHEPSLAQYAEYRFECPTLPDTFHVTGFEASEALNEPYRLTIQLLAADDATDSYQLIGRDAALSILVTGGGSERSLHGIIDSVTIQDNASTRQACSVVVIPALFALSRTVDTRIFQDKTALEIVEELLTEALVPYGRTFHAGSVESNRLLRRSYCVQYRESTLAFVSRMLEEEGIGYYFDHREGPETLVLFDDNRGLARPSTPEAGTLRFGSTYDDLHAWEPLVWFSGTSNRTATRLSTRDYDWRLGSRGLLRHETAVAGPDPRRAHEVYEHGAGCDHVIHEDATLLGAMLQTLVASAVPASVPMPLADLVRQYRGAILDRFSRSNTDDRARIRRETHERDAHVFRGISFVTGLSAGVAFDVVGHPTIGADGEYFVTRIIHASSPPPPSEEAGDDLSYEFRRANYHNRFECRLRATPWRPDHVTPKPRIDGVQTATVTGPEGLDLYTDAFGRIKVRFPWDRADPLGTGDPTCWLRVSQAWAGQGAPAFLFIPRVGMEVVVSFIDGDPDRPLVTGCVYNGDNPTPGLLPAQATKSIIRTRSVPHGPGHNELSFEDAQGMERVYLRAERDWSVLVQNDHEIRVHHNEQVSIGATETKRVGVDQQLRVGRHCRRSIGGNELKIVMGDRTSSVGGIVDDYVRGDCALQVDGAMSTRVPQGEWVLSAAHGVTVLQGGGTSVVRMSSDEDDKGTRWRATDRGFTSPRIASSFASGAHRSSSPPSSSRRTGRPSRSSMLLRRPERPRQEKASDEGLLRRPALRLVRRGGASARRLRAAPAHLRTWIHFHPAGQYKEDGELWAVDDWTAEGRSRFKTRFAEVIRDGFGDGAIWILHNQSGVRDVWCDVKIVHEDDRSKAHLCVNALNNPTPIGSAGGYRSNCVRGGESLLGSVFSLDNPIDMSVTNGVVVGGLVARTKPVSDGPAPVTFLQNVLLHEFGHYLGLRHFCDWAGEPNASEQYCANRTTYEQDDLMAVGNSIRSHHVNPFLSRLGKHEYVPRASCFGFVANDRQKRPWIGDPNWSWAQ